MVLSKGKLIFWLFTALTIGVASGYLFSSKFCSVTIGRRVEKISTLNQSLRQLFALRTFYSFEYLESKILKNLDTEIISQHLSKTNAEISNLIAAYYDKQAGFKMNQWLNGQTNIEEFSATLAELNPVWAASTNAIKKNLLNTENISKQIEVALADENWNNTFNLFEKNLATSLDFADELDKGITQQFPHKF